MRRFLAILAVVLVAVALFMVPGFHVRQDLVWVDAISGSWKRRTDWRFGGKPMPVVRESLLAARYRQLGLRWEPDWKNTAGDDVDVLGRTVGRSHAWPAPAIYMLATSEDLQRLYLATSTDEEVRAFFRIMASGTEAEKIAAAEAACDKAIEHFTAMRQRS